VVGASDITVEERGSNFLASYTKIFFKLIRGLLSPDLIFRKKGKVWRLIWPASSLVNVGKAVMDASTFEWLDRQQPNLHSPAKALS